MRILVVLLGATICVGGVVGCGKSRPDSTAGAPHSASSAETSRESPAGEDEADDQSDVEEATAMEPTDDAPPRALAVVEDEPTEFAGSELEAPPIERPSTPPAG